MTKLSPEFLKTLNSLSREEIKAVHEILRHRASGLEASVAVSFKAGDKVRFDARTKGIITGKVIKVNGKTIKVLSDKGGTWRVSPSLLNKVA